MEYDSYIVWYSIARFFITKTICDIMNTQNLRNRIEEETRLPEVLDGDYHISTVQMRSARPRGTRGNGLRISADSRKDAKHKMMDMMEQRKDGVGVMRIEYIVPHNDKGEWISDQITEELKSLPYIIRERKCEEEGNKDGEALYVADYSVSTEWIED